MQADPVATRVVRVVACNGNVQGSPYRYRGPSRTRASLTKSEAARLVSFNGLLLAPAGWRCDLNGGSGGTTLVAYNPRAGFFNSPFGYQPNEAVSAYYATTGNHALSHACAFFTLAASLYDELGLGSCGSGVDPPVGEQRTQITAGEVRFVDPPHVGGTGNPSGGPNRAVGIELFEVRYDRSGRALQDAATATCALAPARRHFCAGIFRNVRLRFQVGLLSHK